MKRTCVDDASRRFAGVIAVMLVLLTAASGFGQSVTGTISGTVKDGTGASVPGTKIVVQNEDTGVSRELQADASGYYTASLLGLGNYRVTATKDGFQTQIRTGIVLTIGQEAVVDVVLSVGAVTQTVEVSGQVAAIETTNATISSLVSQDQMRNLPLNGRSIDQLALLNPGVFPDQSAQRSGGLGSGLKLSINGGRVDAVLYLLDGTVVNDHSSGGPGSATKNSLGVESILEFRLLTHNFSAEYGRVSGGVMSQVTRSGTNEFHGTGYEFVRNNMFDARNFFNPGGLPPFHRNQFGAALGGPILKDRLFFFVNYEGLRQNQGITVNIPVPDASARQGFLPNAAGQLQAVPFNPAVIPYLNLYPLPNGKSYGDGTAQYLQNFASLAHEDYGMARMDFRASDKDNIYWRYVYNPSSAVSPRPVATLFEQNDESTRHFLVLSESHIFSANSLNDFRTAFNRTDPQVNNQPLVSIPPSLGFVPGMSIGRITFTATGGGVAQLPELGPNTAYPQNFPQNLFQQSDTFSIVHGKHSLKFGADLERIQINPTMGSGAALGQYRFGGLSALLAGTPNQFAVSLLGGNNSYERGWRRTLFGWFVQDDFRLLPNLTLNLGLRHEFFTTPTEVNGLSGDLINVTDPKLTPGPPFISPKKNFSPRVGLAWDPTGSGKTSIRLGGGLYYNHLDARGWYMAASANALYQTALTVSNPTFFPVVNLSSLPIASQATSAIQYHLNTPSVAEYSLELQREIAKSISINAGFIGSYGYHMARMYDANVRVPTIQANGTLFFPTTAPRINPNFSDITYIVTDGTYNYNALQVGAQKAMSHGLELHANYTWSKAMSNGDTLGNSVTTASNASTMDPFDRNRDYSLSIYDQRNTFLLTGVYRPTWEFSHGSRFVKAVLGGWAMNGIFRYGSGLPINIEDGFNNSQDQNTYLPDRPNLVSGFSNNPINGVTAGCAGIAAGQSLKTPNRWFDPCAFVLAPAGTYGNLGRNTVTGPGLVNLDAALVKSTALTERFHLEIRWEVFNVLNHPAFALPNRTVFSSNGTYNGSAGVITSTASDNRQMQLGAKVIF